MRKLCFQIIALALITLIAGCASLAPEAAKPVSAEPPLAKQTPAHSAPEPRIEALAERAPVPENQVKKNTSQPFDAFRAEDFWLEIAEARRFTDCSYDPAIASWAKRLTAHPDTFARELKRMQPYLDYVWRQARAMGLPSEVAFLPLVESNYRQVYGSYGSPGGWWQLMPLTARHYGLGATRERDERVDPVKSTQVALKLIEDNLARFDQDLMLAIFAYNAGGLRVARLLEAKSKAPGEIEHVSELGLSSTTENHLNRLIAWGCILAEPAQYGVQLPSPLLEDERLTAQKLSSGMPLEAVSAVLGTRAAEWRKQHPLLSKKTVVQGETTALLPKTFQLQLLALGDLSRFHQPEPKPAQASRRTGIVAARIVNTRQTPNRFTVRNGDNLWTIARRFNMRVAEILSLNPGLKRNTVLKLGQVLRLN